MNTRSKYRTKQRDILVGYFESMPQVHVTAQDVCEHLKDCEAPIGKSTVYRQLERLVDEGIIKKYIIDGNSPACFEYVDPKNHKDADVCFHLKCEKCGKLIHLHDVEMEGMQARLHESYGFKVDPVRTVLYGICRQCEM